jgi:predicted DNA-binding transcriptional regulator AlpA
MHDPLSTTIKAAVERAIATQLPTIIKAVKQAAPAAEPDIDRFYPIKETASRLGKSPCTIWSLERQGKMPPRERLGGTVGYRSSTIKTILADWVNLEPMVVPNSAIKKGERRGRGKAMAS